MGAVWLVFGVKLRRHWRSWLLLTVLIAILVTYLASIFPALWGSRVEPVDGLKGE